MIFKTNLIMASFPPTEWSQMMDMFALATTEEQEELKTKEEFEVNEVVPNLFITG